MSQTIDSREWLWLYAFGNLCKNEETMTYFETHESEKNKILAFRETCGKTFRQCCTEENSTLLCDFIKDLCEERGIITVRRICPEWTFIISQFHCFVLEAKLENIAQGISRAQQSETFRF
jgi:hypothetical protein